MLELWAVSPARLPHPTVPVITQTISCGTDYGKCNGTFLGSTWVCLSLSCLGPKKHSAAFVELVTTKGTREIM